MLCILLLCELVLRPFNPCLCPPSIRSCQPPEVCLSDHGVDARSLVGYFNPSLAGKTSLHNASPIVKQPFSHRKNVSRYSLNPRTSVCSKCPPRETPARYAVAHGEESGVLGRKLFARRAKTEPGRRFLVLGQPGRICRVVWSRPYGVRGHQRTHREDGQGQVSPTVYAQKGDLI